MTVTAHEKSSAVQQLEQITDVPERAAKSAEYADGLHKRVEALRADRNAAMVMLLHAGKKKAWICELLNITRPTADKVFRRAAAGQHLPTVAGDQEQIALDRHTEAERLDRERLDAIAVRDAAVTTLLFDPAYRMTNAEVARLTGIHRVRVAQLRSEALGQ